MAKMIDKKPTYNGEAKVWERLNEYLPNDIVVYNQREINGREYDFCLMIENVGMLIIEVKGWKADKICVNGVDEIEVEGYDKTQTSPKKQARAYRFALLNKISEKYNVSPLVLDMVCYPFISKEEYLEKHLNIISEEAYTIFSEDLDDGDLLNKKINTVFEKNNLIPHSDFTYDLMLRIRRNYEPDLMKKNEYADAITPYSKLFFLPSSVDASKCKEVVDMYAAGVKTVVFVERRESFKSILSYLDYFLKKMNIGYKKNNLFVGSSEKMEKHYEDDIFRIFNFELYMYSALSRICETSFEIVEGKVTDDNKIILRKLSENTEFNLQQYEVEHATTEKNILVEAGAGTGKTFSMVSRVAFLCNKELDPVMNIADEIAMVTFTNDAAINMKKRLKQMFINYFVLTGSEKYLKYVEDIDRSQISTIHKFAIGILRGESLYTGLGTNFRISSNEYKRGKAYDIFLGEFLEEMEEKNSNFVNELPVPIYDLKKKLMSIADKLFAKSINLEQIKPAEMGVTVDNNIPYFNELLTRVVFPAEATYIESMKNSNDVDLKECLIELGKVLSSGCEIIEDLRLRYMFIDEFQDTDDVQIEIFQKLQALMNADCKLFVVGDLKQSIYRFRGAKLNAFQKLQYGKDIEWKRFRLNRNYRTDGRLLELFDGLFAKMGSQGVLPYQGEEDRLTSNVFFDATEENLFVELSCHGKDAEALLELLVDTLDEEKKKIDYMEGIILIAGILMTGSRSVFVLMLVSICFLLLKKKIPLKYFGIGFTGAVAVLIILQLLMNLDITRLLKMTINSSTLNGRILYWYDGIRQLLKNPFGLGYMGYFFKQPEFQTGNYVIRYVHNDFLQMGLDNGIISLIVFVVIVLGGAFSKKICGRNRLILIVLALHSFFDFDLQYGFMFCILLMTLDTESKKVCECKKAYGYGVVSVMMAISVYFSLALGFEHFGKSQAALTLYPADTFALQDELNENGDAAVAEMIIEKNGMIASAYEIVASDEADNGNYNASMKHLDDMLKYAGYDGYYYNQAVFYYSKCLDTAVRSEDIEATRDILNKITQMPQLIAQKEADASTFAQRINDKPKIELTDDIQNYIEKMSEIKFTD